MAGHVPFYVTARNRLIVPDPPFDPLTLPGMQFYIDASLGNGVGFTADGSYAVPTAAGGISDQSSYSRDSNYAQPTVYAGDPADQINGLSVFDFASPSYATFDGIASTIYAPAGSTRTVFLAAVVNRTTGGADRSLFCLPFIANQDHQSFLVQFNSANVLVVTCGTGSTYASGASLQSAVTDLTVGLASTSLVLIMANTTTIRVRINGVEASMSFNANGTSMPMANFLSGTGGATLDYRVAARQHSSGVYPLEGRVGQLFVLDNIPDEPTISQLETHLLTKWGIA